MSTSLKQIKKRNHSEELFAKAALLVVLYQKASSSFLQRELNIGYHLAGQIMDRLEVVGIISQFAGSEPRMIYIKEPKCILKFFPKLLKFEISSGKTKRPKSIKGLLYLKDHNFYMILFLKMFSQRDLN